MYQRVERLISHPLFAPFVLGLLIVTGIYFRVVRLGDAALRADTITFWKICASNLSAREIFVRWFDLMGTGSNQFPFANAFTKWCMDVFGLPTNHFGVRLPSAIWGALAVPVGFALGRSLAGVRCGLVLAGMVALNAYHIQVTREAYFYAPMVLGAFLTTWGGVWAIQLERSGEKPSGKLYAVLALGFLLLVYCQPSGWSMAFLSLLFFIGAAIRRSVKAGKIDSASACVVLMYVLLFLPMVFVEWGIPQFHHNITGDVKEMGLRGLTETHARFGSMFANVLTAFGWGSTPLRIVFTILILACGFYVIVRNAKKERQYLYPVYLFFGGFALFLVGQRLQGTNFSTRYVVAVLPAYLAMLALGITRVGEQVLKSGTSLPARRGVVTGVLVVSAACLAARPAVLSTRLQGKPTPYKDIVAWVDSNLPRGAPVLVDRWYEPWNELKVHASTNVFFTFTVPNEPLEAFRQNHWRETAQQFFLRFPDAAYLEITKAYWDSPGVGPWDWTREYFARRHVITNSAGLSLRKLGLASREDFYIANTNRLIVELFYNTTQDVLAKARQMNKSLLALYGQGWGYTKTQDYRDWRVLEAAASFELYNLTQAPLDAMFVLSGTAVNGDKDVLFGGSQTHTFKNGESAQLTLGPMSLPPGQSEIVLADPNWNARRAPLLVGSVEIRPAAETSSAEMDAPESE